MQRKCGPGLLSPGLVAFFAALVLLGGCSKSDQESAQREIQRQAGDAWICTQVRAAATELDPATVSLVKISCARGVVTLKGQVRSAQERSQLEAATRKVDGVRAVNTEIAINPKAPTGNEIADDLTLAAKVRVALAGQTGLNAFKFNISAHRGVVTLEGSVASQALKSVALDTARGVSGVKGVVDKLSVQR